MAPKYLYRIVSKEEWVKSQKAEKLLLGDFDKEFIHLATKEQLDNIIAKYWQNTPNPLILKIEASQLPGRLVLETNPGGSTKYYHLYDGYIPLAICEIE